MIKRTGKRYRTWMAGCAAVLAIVPIASACSFGAKDDANERRTLRIGMSYGSKNSEMYVRQELTDMFELSHKNIDIEYVNAIDYSDRQFTSEEEYKKLQQIDPYEKLKEIMTGDNPVDVVFTDLNQLHKLVQDNLIKPLDPMIKEDKMDLSDFLPAVLDTIREQGNGQLYGLSSTFSNSALFYNKKLFAKAGINPPTDGMTWDEVFALARSMKSGTGKDAVYGFNTGSYGGGLNFYDLYYSYVEPLNLRMFDAAGEKMTVDTDLWKKAFGKPFDLYKDHVIPHPEDLQANQPQNGRYNPYQGRPFIQGQVAMEIGGYYQVNDLISYNKNVDKMKGAEKLDWDVVTLPTHPEAQNGGVGIGLGNLAVINAKAANPKDAWALIKHLNSDEVAKFKARSMSDLSVRQTYLKPKEGETYRIEAFTNFKPGVYMQSDADEKLYRERPNLNLIMQVGQLYVTQAINGKLTLDEALKSWQTKGNDLLQKIKLNPTGDLNGEIQAIQEATWGGSAEEKLWMAAGG
ncbi:ABC transporter substrate-binding protein [Cohnella sp. REN36]|uniref:ABC transporter substrate-binding protein n=1 Tax=Cohnella sp. REN36 TaxID=2887347 RepID=UPI001D142913|nr:extracellular solute-binding protein [Cohnella sp. REN36]MCC3372905.1 extracellular solute-binding protein [Cohnella sp. REN36]